MNNSPFKEVSIWEIEKAYVTTTKRYRIKLEEQMRNYKYARIAREINQPLTTVRALGQKFENRISVELLHKVLSLLQLSVVEAEKSIRKISISHKGQLVNQRFPLKMNIYAWRIICHILGDGNIGFGDNRRPYARWIQLRKNQRSMRALIAKLGGSAGGEKDQVYIPNGLIYPYVQTMPLCIGQLNTVDFVRFIYNLPMSFKDYKVQFLAAFIVDEGCVNRSDISLTQKSLEVLEQIKEICSQLEYNVSSNYRDKRNNVYSFQLRSQAVAKFENDLKKNSNGDILLQLWQKQEKLENSVLNTDFERIKDNKRSKELIKLLLNLVYQNPGISTNELFQNESVRKYVGEGKRYQINRKLDFLRKMMIIEESKKGKRPKTWKITNNRTLIEHTQFFENHYAQRTGPHTSKSRKPITNERVECGIEIAKQKSINPSRTNIAKIIGCSRKQLYARKDLDKYFSNKKI